MPQSQDHAPKQKWSPIECAPINASVLVFIPNAEHYGPGIYRALRPKFGILRPWQVTGLHMGRDCGRGYQPTHWMPLPSVPDDNDADAPTGVSSKELLAVLKIMVASAHPHPMQHGAMYEAWETARATIKRANSSSSSSISPETNKNYE